MGMPVPLYIPTETSLFSACIRNNVYTTSVLLHRNPSAQSCECTCIPIQISISRSLSLSLYIFVYLYILACLTIAYMHAYMHTCMHACVHTYIHTYMHACMHACMHAYIHTYIHTDRHIRVQGFSGLSGAPGFGVYDLLVQVLFWGVGFWPYGLTV